MIKEKFFQNKLALITLLSACGIVAVSMGLRQTFGLFSDFFVKDLQCTVTQATDFVVMLDVPSFSTIIWSVCL